jgi:hypothetical protein
VFQLFLAKAKHFYLFQKFWNKFKTFRMCSNIFLAKAKRYYLIKKLRNRTKMLGISSQISKNKTELFVVSRKIWKLNKPIAFGPKILKCFECFVLIMNFFFKNEYIQFFGGHS